MKSLQEDMKQDQFKQVYLLYGEESYLKNVYKNKLREAMLPADDTMNFSYYEGKGINKKELIDLAETLPFFAPRRLIMIENSGFFKEASPDLAEYLGELPAETHFIFVEEAIDKRGKMFKTVKKVGRVVEMGTQDEKTLTRWILGKLKQEKRNITQATMQEFLVRAGSDMGNIEKELEKLICYTMGRDIITEQDVRDVCTVQTTNKIFDMINAIAAKRQKRALELYYDLLALKEPPMRILFLITRQFNLLMQVKDLMKLGFDNTSIGKKTGLHGFVVRNYVAQARSFSKEQLRAAVEDCAATEEAVKTGKMNDTMSVELLIVKYSR